MNRRIIERGGSGERRATGEPLSRTTSSAINFVIYQAGWFSAVLLAAGGRPGPAALAALAVVALHLTLAAERRRELALVIAAALLGFVVDSWHVRLGVLEYAGVAAGVAPLWIVALWMKFATTLRFCMRWMSGRYVLAAVLGAFGGPLSFAAGARLGAAEFLLPMKLGLVVLGISWAVAMPLLVLLATRRGGVRDASGRYAWSPGAASPSRSIGPWLGRAA